MERVQSLTKPTRTNKEPRLNICHLVKDLVFSTPLLSRCFGLLFRIVAICISKINPGGCHYFRNLRFRYSPNKYTKLRAIGGQSGVMTIRRSGLHLGSNDPPGHNFLHRKKEQLQVTVSGGFKEHPPFIQMLLTLPCEN